jgi:hypothetical protein
MKIVLLFTHIAYKGRIQPDELCRGFLFTACKLQTALTNVWPSNEGTRHGLCMHIYELPVEPVSSRLHSTSSVYKQAELLYNNYRVAIRRITWHKL